MQQLNVASADLSASGKAVNLFDNQDNLVATVNTANDTPEKDDILGWVKDHMEFNANLNGSFIRLSEPSNKVALTSLFGEPTNKKAKA